MDLDLQARIPVNRYRPSAPLEVELVSTTRLTPAGSPNDVRHLVLRWPKEEFSFLEGQSVGIVPPGHNARGRPHPVRLFSIASARAGEDGDGRTLALLVKRFFWTVPDTGEVIPGLCSNHLCDARPGDVLRMTGPVGREMVPDDWTAPMILVATGTGIAPFRGFLQARDRLARRDRAPVLLVYGAQTAGDLCYAGWLDGLAASDPTLWVAYARSREETTADGRRLYVQDRLALCADVAWPLLRDPRCGIYLCGLRGMEDGVDAALAATAMAHGGDWPALRQALHAEHRYRIEVY